MGGLQARLQGGDELAGFGFVAKGHAVLIEAYLPAALGLVYRLYHKLHGRILRYGDPQSSRRI
jgi:hypothetical protein